MNRCIVSVATALPGGNDSYLRHQQRQVKSIDQFDMDYIAWRDEMPPGSPSHSKVPYGFKPFAFAEAMSRGFTSVLWCDSSVWARKDPAPVFDLIESQGHVFFRNGWNCGQWCTDAALEKHGLTRDAAMQIPDFTGCCMGLDLTNKRSLEFFHRWKHAAEDSVSFIGAWTNENGQCSPDKRCLGHRHDQVIGSIIAHRMEMPLTDPGELFSYWNDGKILDSVVMVNGRG